MISVVSHTKWAGNFAEQLMQDVSDATSWDIMPSVAINLEQEDKQDVTLVTEIWDQGGRSVKTEMSTTGEKMVLTGGTMIGAPSIAKETIRPEEEEAKDRPEVSRPNQKSERIGL